MYREIDVESDDETLYQSKRSSHIKRDQHSSLPDLTESLTDSSNINDISQISDHIEPSSSTSSVSTTAILSPTSPITMDSKRKGIKIKTKRCKLILDYFFLQVKIDHNQLVVFPPHQM
jgi:hypothetical protein